MIHVSIRELTSVYGNLFRSFGLDAGSAHEATQIVAWMDLHGLRGFESLCGRVREAEAEGGFDVAPGMTWRDGALLNANGNGGSLLAIGPAFVDLAIAMHRLSGTTRAFCGNVADMEFAPGLAGILESRGASAAARCLDGHSACVFEFHTSASGTEVWQPFPRQGAASDRGSIEVSFGDGKSDLAVELPHDGWSASTSAALSNGRVHQWRRGMSVEPGAWEFLCCIANRMLVPESEDSRLRGAGIGADDN